MNLIIQFFVIIIAVLFAGSIIILLYYLARKNDRTRINNLNEDHFLKTDEGLSDISNKSDQILREVKNISESINNTISNKAEELISIINFLDKVGIKNRKIDPLSDKIDRLTFNLITEEKNIIRFGILIEKETERIIISTHSLFLNRDDRKIYRSLLQMNAIYLPKYTIREIDSNIKVLCIEYTIFGLLLPYSLFEFAYNLLISANMHLVSTSKKEKWIAQEMKMKNA